jgi:hypothetical protein
MSRCFASAWVVAVAVLIASGTAGHAQTLKEQLVGSWVLTSGIEKYPDKTVTPWETGNLTLTSDGRASFFLIGKDRQKGSNPRDPVGPAIAYYGSYSVDESAKAIIFHVERGVAPLFDKTDRRQSVSFNGDTLVTSTVPTQTPEGMMTPVNEWKRAK